MDEAPPRLTVGVIGVGRAGAVLAAALHRAGHAVKSAHAVSPASRQRAEELIPEATLVDIPQVLEGSDLVLLTVPDDVLPGLVQGLTRAGQVRPGQLLVHCSGRYGAAVLDPATGVGALPLALHPVMTFTGTSMDLTRLSGCPFGVTAPAAIRPVAEALVVEMGGEPFWVAEEQRARYHAALAHASNHLVTLVADAMAILAAAGVSDPQRVLAPLVSASADNALRLAMDGLTGPVVRGDSGTVAEHLAALESMPESRTAYIAMARLTADKALAAGRLPAQQAESLLEVLASKEGPR
jgi:predicted short-subunit dehydrogenase-like oxidoreductase (DUF2520 family)